MFDAQSIVTHILQAADPAEAVRRGWPQVLTTTNRLTLIAAGKAARPMVDAVLDLRGGRVDGGVAALLPSEVGAAHWPFAAYPAAHPYPDARNIRVGRTMMTTAKNLTADDTLLVLLSGGGSALMAYPVAVLTLGDILTITRALMQAGASIDELNAVRKHCEVLKGGGLARLAAPARVYALILSDVVGDRLDVIASGPVTADPTTYDDALAVLDKYQAREVAPGVTAHLEAGARGENPETLKPGAAALERVTTRIVGSNADALRAARDELSKQGFSVVDIQAEVRGEAREIGRRLAEQAKGLKPGQAIIYGGETTVTVNGEGRGGRNQEMALAAGLRLEGCEGITVMTLATDGIDGPTDAAGAVVDGMVGQQIKVAGIDPHASLERNDSYTALDAVGRLLRTGPTGTNVNDVAIAVCRR